MNRIFILSLVSSIAFSTIADARIGGRVGGFRSFSRPSISRSYSRSSVKPVKKPTVKPETKTSSDTITHSSTNSTIPWFFNGYMIGRSSKNGKISCDCSVLKNQPELYKKCIENCPR